MKKITLKAYAKINLTLDVLGKREDSYHNVKMIMQSIDFYDTVKVKITDTKKVEVICPGIVLEQNKENIAKKAADIFFKVNKIDNPGLLINIIKRIPEKAGLAGGSADAAATLKALNILFETNLTAEKLIEIGAMVGSDVPFCITLGTCLCEGIGEKLTMLKPFLDCYILIIKPDCGIDTGNLYDLLDNSVIENRPDTDAMISAIENKDLYLCCKNIVNVMQPVSEQLCPDIKRFATYLRDFGAKGVAMTGSGSAVFGIFHIKPLAKLTKKFFEKKFNYFVTLTKPINFNSY